MGNRFPAWLSPGVEDLLPIPASTVWGRLGAGIQNANLTEVERARAGTKRGKARAAALTPERRSEIARNAALALHARLTHGERSALGRAGGLASQAARSPAQRTASGRAGAKVTNKLRWGFNG